MSEKLAGVGLDLAWIASVTGARSARRGERLQSLWSGYGEIVRVHLEGTVATTVVVKSVTPPSRPASDVGDARKRRSYDAERRFYESFRERCDDTCRVPRLHAARGSEEEGRWLFVLEDLDAAGFPARRGPIAPCVDWLASFHARFLGVEPRGLWEEGTYWHLATRLAELAAVTDAAVKKAAPVLDAKLRSCTYRTLVHGDAKLANFCFSRDGKHVAAVDFQYVGGGSGMRDVAYLLTGERDEDALLERYFDGLQRALDARALDRRGIDGVEDEWRSLYPVAVADFRRFLAGWSYP